MELSESGKKLESLAKEFDINRKKFDKYVANYLSAPEERKEEIYRAAESLGGEINEQLGVLRNEIIQLNRKAKSSPNSEYRAEVENLSGTSLRNLQLIREEVSQDINALREQQTSQQLTETEWSEYFYSPCQTTGSVEKV